MRTRNTCPISNLQASQWIRETKLEFNHLDNYGLIFKVSANVYTSKNLHFLHHILFAALPHYVGHKWSNEVLLTHKCPNLSGLCLLVLWILSYCITYPVSLVDHEGAKQTKNIHFMILLWAGNRYACYTCQSTYCYFWPPYKPRNAQFFEGDN